MHYKYMIFGIILLTVVVFGLLFWDNFAINQKQLAETPLSTDDSTYQTPVDGTSLSGSDSYDAIDADLNGTDVNSVDAGSSEIEAEASGL